MEQATSSQEVDIQVDTLESEVKSFAESLPYWLQYLCEKLLDGQIITDDHIDTSYAYFLEDAGLIEKTERPELIINCTGNVSSSYKAEKMRYF
jgi:hypothetical protein